MRVNQSWSNHTKIHPNSRFCSLLFFLEIIVTITHRVCHLVTMKWTTTWASAVCMYENTYIHTYINTFVHTTVFNTCSCQTYSSTNFSRCVAASRKVTFPSQNSLCFYSSRCWAEGTQACDNQIFFCWWKITLAWQLNQKWIEYLQGICWHNIWHRC